MAAETDLDRRQREKFNSIFDVLPRVREKVV